MDEQAGNDGNDGFFYPEHTEARGRQGVGGRPPGRSPRGSSRLPWLLCAFLLALMAAQLVWIDAPLRRALREGSRAQQAAMEAVTRLEAQASAATGREPEVPPAAVPVDEDRVWAQNQCQTLFAALGPSWPPDRLQLRGREFMVALPLADTFGAGSSQLAGERDDAKTGWHVAVSALVKTLAGDEMPYRLSIVLPLHQEDAPPRRRHGRRRRSHDDSTANSAPALAFARARALLASLDQKLALRAKSSIEAVVARPDADLGFGPAPFLVLRVSRLAG